MIAAMTTPGRQHTTDGMTIYLSDADDAIARLAQLDSARRPNGPVLVAAVDGEPRAALELGGGAGIADPFHPTTELLSLLELRAAQMSAHPSSGRLARLVARLRSGARPRSLSHDHDPRPAHAT